VGPHEIEPKAHGLRGQSSVGQDLKSAFQLSNREP